MALKEYVGETALARFLSKLSAKFVGYDNEESGLEATTVQGAVDEINSNLVYTPLTSTSYGVLKIGSYKRVWSSYPTSAMTLDSASGKYRATINLSNYNFNPDAIILGQATFKYSSGNTDVGVVSASSTSIVIFCAASVSSGYVNWEAYGECTD